MSGPFAVIYGLFAYGSLLGTILYAIGFTGNLVVAKTIDSGPDGPLLQNLLIDTALLGLFAVQHGVMARRGFRSRWTRFVPFSVERSTSILAACLAIAILFWQWRPISEMVWAVQDPATAGIINAVFWLGWAIVASSAYLIGYFEFFGAGRLVARLGGDESAAPAFRAPLMYRRLRHLIYLGLLMALWAEPSMSIGHLLFCVVTTFYLSIATQVEERDLTLILRAPRRREPQRAGMPIPVASLSRPSKQH